MDTTDNTPDSLNEAQSLMVIKEMIQVSKTKFKRDGILFVVWGWVLFSISIIGYVERNYFLTFSAQDILNVLEVGLPLLAITFSIVYLVKQRKRVQTYIGISLRFVWVSLFVSMVLVNLIQFNVLHSINFELQHPIFMVLMAFAVTVTGGILRYRLLIIGGIIFALLALTASYLELEAQLLVEAAAWVIAFIVPGHILFANRKK